MKLNQNELLDLVFREDKKRFYDEEFKSNTGMRRKYKKIFSDEKYVSYDTYYGGGLGTARERQRFNGDRYIEFQDRDGIVTGTAELTDNMWGKKKLVYRDPEGNIVHERDVSDDEISSINSFRSAVADSQKNHGSSSNTGNNAPDGSDSHGGDSSLAFVSLGILLPFAIAFSIPAVLMMCFLEHIQTIYKAGSFLITYLSMPITLLILSRLPGFRKDSSGIVHRACRVQLILSGITMAAVAGLCAYLMSPSVMLGHYSFRLTVLPFAPLLFHSLATGIYRIIARGSDDSDFVAGICQIARLVTGIATLVLQFLALTLGDFCFNYTHSFGNLVSCILGSILAGIIGFVAVLVTWLPENVVLFVADIIFRIAGFFRRKDG